jgi:hypothetical protein
MGKMVVMGLMGILQMVEAAAMEDILRMVMEAEGEMVRIALVVEVVMVAMEVMVVFLERVQAGQVVRVKMGVDCEYKS